MDDEAPPHADAPSRAVDAEGLRDLAALLRLVNDDRTLLRQLPLEERTELVNLAGDLWCDDPQERRRRIKARRRRERREKLARDEAVLDSTGIRTLRNQPVFVTPNVAAPVDAGQVPVDEFVGQTAHEQHCYVCKAHFTEIHHFYDQLCPECAALNYTKRTEGADLSGTVALLTGGRVKIGYQAGIKLLRCGARLIVTTRFPRDAAARYAAEPDADEWTNRLQIYGLDLRHTPSVEAFCRHLDTKLDRLDFIINNACQTVRRPPDFYRHMMDGETAALDELPPAVLALVGEWEGLRRDHIVQGDAAGSPATAALPAEPPTEPPTVLPTDLGGGAPAGAGDLGSRHSREARDAPGLMTPAELSQAALLPDDAPAGPEGGDAADRGALFPEGRLDQDLQQVDLRETNSWRLLLHEVSSVELLETQLVNAVAPFVLNARLRPLMERTPNDRPAPPADGAVDSSSHPPHKHVVNVSAVEGQFYRKYKTTRHPHTNMAKAALNMMTRTSAADYHGSGIHMNSVDTGWVTDEDPRAIAAQKQHEHGFHPPLDIVDGAARIVDPIIDGVNTGVHRWGQFLKDYRPTDW